MMTNENEFPNGNEPVRLSDAVKLFFPFGGLTVSTLRTEVRKGNLVIERIGGKDFVTKLAIEEMRKKCRVKAEAQSSILESVNAGQEPKFSDSERLKRAQAAAPAILDALKKHRS